MSARVLSAHRSLPSFTDVMVDAQEYYANTGALKRAAENARTDGGKVGVSIVEAFGKQARCVAQWAWHRAGLPG